MTGSSAVRLAEAAGFGDSRGPVGESRISDAARDEPAGARLWTLSEELLDITWNIT